MSAVAERTGDVRASNRSGSLARAAKKDRACIYCGSSWVGGAGLVCHKCSDLPALDPEWEAWKLRRWWLRNFSAAEIEVLAACVGAAAPETE